MADITLIRHGPPLLTPWRWGGRKAFRRFLSEFDGVPVDPAWPPPPDLARRAAAAGAVFASPAARARTSAELLLADRLPVIDSLFVEAPVAVPPLPVPLPLTAWVALGRIAWLTGVGQAAESPQQSRARAGLAADRLVDAAERHGSAVLVGHGWFNRLIGSALRARGWYAGSATGDAHWSHRSYHPEQAPAVDGALPGSPFEGKLKMF